MIQEPLQSHREHWKVLVCFWDAGTGPAGPALGRPRSSPESPHPER